jgi:hypothetical protein
MRTAPVFTVPLVAACSVTAPPETARTSSLEPLPSLSDPAPDRRPEPPCAADADCGYDPALDRCAADPRANRQPPLRDQGIICYCGNRACSTLRVAPVPCEFDASCAVRDDPRPHPVAASREHPHERGRPCRDFTIATTCERTNICTMHVLPCKAP